jgi:hypothetical protein
MITTPMMQLLLNAGFNSGWVLSDEKLILWEHDTEPPAPLTRPDETAPTVG